MKTLLIASLALLGAHVHADEAWTGGSIPMVFSNTDVAHALRALSLRTGTGVVYAAGKEKVVVTLNVIAASPEEAIRHVASAAGLVYRKVGKIFVVAPPAGMRQALEPYGVRTVFSVEEGASADLVAKLQEALPYATVRAAGDKIVVVGAPEDVEAARTALSDLQSGAAGRRLSTDVVLLVRAVPATVAPLIASLYPDIKVTPTLGDKPGGALAFTGPASQLQDARATAEKLDAGMGVDQSVFRVYNLRYMGATSVVEFLKQGAPAVEAFAGPEAFIPNRATFDPLTAGMASATGASAGASTGSAPATTQAPTSAAAPVATASGDRAKTLVLRGRQSDVDNALRLLAEVDRKPKQIVVEVNVIETSPQNDETTGILYNWTSFDFYESPRGSGVPSSTTKAPGLGLFSRIPWNFNAVLRALVTKKEARILARPSIRVVDNGQASVFIGDTIRARIVTGGALGAQNVEIREFPVGIILLLAPRINADGNITLHVNPVVSTVTSVDEFNVPQTSSREAETTAIVKDGETVVLGGLIRDEDIKTVQEIPLLSKLPFVGELFRNRIRSRRRSDILVSITPHIIDDEPKTEAKP